MPGKIDSVYSWSRVPISAVILPSFSPDITPTPSFLEITGEGLALMNRGVGVSDDGRQRVGDLPRGIALPPEMPRQTDLINAPAIDVEGPQALGHQRARLDGAAGSGDRHPIEGGN